MEKEIEKMKKYIERTGLGRSQQINYDINMKNGYLIRRVGNDYNMPTQKAMEMGLFEIKETSITHSDGHTSVSKTPKVTGKSE